MASHSTSLFLVYLCITLLLSLVNTAVFCTDIDVSADGQQTISASTVAYNSAIQKFSEKNSAQELLAEHNKIHGNVSQPAIVPTIAYVTPWNRGGQDIATKYAKKFDGMSPVWMYIQSFPVPGEDKTRRMFQIVGGMLDATEAAWIKQVREANPKTLIMPRVSLDKWDNAAYMEFFVTQEMPKNMQGKNVQTHIEKIARNLVGIAKQNDFDGFIIEFGYLQVGKVLGSVRGFLDTLRTKLARHNKRLVYVIPSVHDWRELISPGNGTTAVTNGDIKELESSVDGFSLMTYDFQMQDEVGLGVSPLEWCEANLRYFAAAGEKVQKKLFMGLNWYGRDYSTENHDPIIGSQFLEVLEKESPALQWDHRTHEHYYEKTTKGKQGRVYYPSQLSVYSRILLAQKYGIAGVAIWEIGQGLEHFIDAL